jgi:hypothetical protein
MPDLLPRPVCQEIIQIDLIPAITDMLTVNVIRLQPGETEGRMQPALLVDRDNPKNREEWLA